MHIIHNAIIESPSSSRRSCKILSTISESMEEAIAAVRAHMRGLRPPGHHDKVYKDECMFSFATPESPGGLYINLKTFQVGVASQSVRAKVGVASQSELR